MRTAVGAALILFCGSVGLDYIRAQHAADAGQWLAHGGDKGATRYSALDQIHSDGLEAIFRLKAEATGLEAIFA